MSDMMGRRINITKDIEQLAKVNPEAAAQLRPWYEQIKGFKKLSLTEVKELYRSLIKQNGGKKEQYLTELIEGTLYQVFHFVCNSGFTALKGSVFALDDIMAISIDEWHKMLVSGALLNKEVYTFKHLFGREFYICVTKQYIGESKGYNNYGAPSIKLDRNTFGRILKKYVENIKAGLVYDEQSCYVCINNLLDETGILPKLKSHEIYQIYMVFYSFLKSLNIDDINRIPAVELGSLKLALLEMIDSNNSAGLIETGDFTDEIHKRFFVEELIDSLNERERLVVEMFYGFSTGEPKTKQEVAKSTGLTGARIGQILNEAHDKMKRLIKLSYRIDYNN